MCSMLCLIVCTTRATLEVLRRYFCIDKTFKTVHAQCSILYFTIVKNNYQISSNSDNTSISELMCICLEPHFNHYWKIHITGTKCSNGLYLKISCLI